MPKSSVRVFVRLRPAVHPCDAIAAHPDGKSICIQGRGRALDGAQQDTLLFKFDGVFQNTGQEAIFDETAREVVEGVVNGYNGTLLAYGQTGAGKTLTMSGEPRAFNQRGIIPRAIHQIYRAAESKPEGSVNIRVSYLEIYNETMYDLLAETPGHSNGLTVTEDANGCVEVRGLTRRPAASEEAALACFFEGEAGRSTAAHYLNASSSRSHCIFTVHVEAEAGLGSAEKVTSSKLHLVDLAGSERLKKTHVVGESLREATAINKSLTFLEQVVNALATNQAHITFRQTKLTSVLKDALGGNCKTVMIACCWAEDEFLEETLSTLRFAQRVKSLTTTVTVSEKSDPATMIRRLERQVMELKQELAMKDALSGKGRVSYSEPSDGDLQEVRPKVDKFLAGESGLDTLPMDSVKQIKETYRLFKDSHSQTRAQLEKDLAALRASRPANEAAAQSRPGTAGMSNGTTADDSTAVGEVEQNANRSIQVGEAPTQARPKDAAYLERGNAAANSGKAVSPNGTARRNGAPERGGPESPAGRETEAERKNRAFLRYKHEEEEGKAAGARVQELANKIRNGRLTVRDLGTKVNDAKHEIDQLKQNLDARKEAAGAGAAAQERARVPAGVDAPEDAEVLDEEQFALLQKIKTAKNAYRESFDQLRALRSDLEQMESEAARCRQTLVEGFERWHGAQPHSPNLTRSPRADGDRFGGLLGADVADNDSEAAFLEDPESHAFFAAQKAATGHKGSLTHRNIRR